mgnify:CR=1 FL=1
MSSLLLIPVRTYACMRVCVCVCESRLISIPRRYSWTMTTEIWTKKWLWGGGRTRTLWMRISTFQCKYIFLSPHPQLLQSCIHTHTHTHTADSCIAVRTLALFTQRVSDCPSNLKPHGDAHDDGDTLFCSLRCVVLDHRSSRTSGTSRTWRTSCRWCTMGR